MQRQYDHNRLFQWLSPVQVRRSVSREGGVELKPQLDQTNELGAMKRLSTARRWRTCTRPRVIELGGSCRRSRSWRGCFDEPGPVL